MKPICYIALLHYSDVKKLKHDSLYIDYFFLTKRFIIYSIIYLFYAIVFH